MLYIPSPISISYQASYLAVANRSGRMQYYMQTQGESRVRIARGEFISAYNELKIIAVKPIQSNLGDSVFQLEFYTASETQ
jgi:hypothetical protein